MYISDDFRETDPTRLDMLIQNYPFGALITTHDGLPFVSHIPFICERRQDGALMLIGHMAKANPQWHNLAQGQTALVIFQGQNAYVSPSWYGSPGVPTWNYVVVHVYGEARLIEDEDSLEKLVEKLTALYESNQPHPWTPVYSTERRAKLLGMIVGFEIEAEKTQGNLSFLKTALSKTNCR